jgi:hypothetical protein
MITNMNIYIADDNDGKISASKLSVEEQLFLDSVRSEDSTSGSGGCIIC